MRAGSNVGEGGREESRGAKPLIRERGPWTFAPQFKMLMASSMTTTSRIQANLRILESSKYASQRWPTKLNVEP